MYGRLQKKLPFCNRSYGGITIITERRYCVAMNLITHILRKYNSTYQFVGCVAASMGVEMLRKRQRKQVIV